jgi:hypothetical protein
LDTPERMVEDAYCSERERERELISFMFKSRGKEIHHRQKKKEKYTKKTKHEDVICFWSYIKRT